jgi:hypothetical protein
MTTDTRHHRYSVAVSVTIRTTAHTTRQHEDLALESMLVLVAKLRREKSARVEVLNWSCVGTKEST